VPQGDEIMIYIEYIDRDRHMPNQIFRQFANQSSWTDPDDGLVGMFGRTMRIGPYPAYFAFWKCKGMERMDEWEAYFRSEEFGSHKSEQATFEAIHLVRGGCYDALVDQSPVDQQALFCIEYFGAAQGDDDEKVADHFRSREAATEGARLDFVLRRIGALGPNPGCLAVWSFPDYVSLEPFQRLNLDDDTYRPQETGVYRWFGRDIL
jgi:hypothetical protein